jgi:hypothetical protein
MKFVISVYSENLFRNFKPLTRITDTLHEDIRTFMIISRSDLFTTRNISDKYRENQNTRFCSITFSENGAFYEVMWKNMVQSERPQMTLYYGACALHAG